MEEESEMFVSCEKEKVKRAISKIVPVILKEILKEQNRM